MKKNHVLNHSTSLFDAPGTKTLVLRNILSNVNAVTGLHQLTSQHLWFNRCLHQDLYPPSDRPRLFTSAAQTKCVL